ncbi:NADH-quinone oxidoreductase subunit J family protein [Herpetosiphon geysericola]|uniref:NADH-quinone oxidoreductase subunit J n=1 Tax=Herpetosiphon geysericola TaxID=70996 RepID=A0A0P6XLW1_9CHLR|nr:NADH-quinone oxidoreductase subunit J [Herpetosiphon geysericola]KPL81333.1 NADH-ubiquinone oxidoreductase [Herpetosiphon geysericola]
MNPIAIGVFIVIALLTLGSGIMVVTVRNIIHSALWLIASFIGVAALYLLMEAEFLAVVQILVYAGAVSILVLFAIMLTRQVTGEGVRVVFERWWVALLIALGLFGVIVPTLWKHGATWEEAAKLAQVGPAPVEGAANSLQVATATEIGRSFMGEYLLPFEVVSVLLLMALIGAVVIAYEERTRRRRVLTLAEELALKKRGIVEPRDAEGAVVPREAEAAVILLDSEQA